jgi:outer membrane protein
MAMRTRFAVLMLVAGFMAPIMAMAEQGDFLVRVRALWMNTADKSEAIPALGVPLDVIHVDNKVFPEVDFSYFLTKNLALELILTYPQSHDVTLSGINIGSVKHLPPTLTLQYHFLPDQKFRPYVGAGINYTIFTDRDLFVPGVNIPLETERDSFGAALQVGADFEVAKNMFVNVDLKKVWIDSDLTALGVRVSSIDIDPLLVSVGLGWKF